MKFDTAAAAFGFSIGWVSYYGFPGCRLLSFESICSNLMIMRFVTLGCCFRGMVFVFWLNSPTFPLLGVLVPEGGTRVLALRLDETILLILSSTCENSLSSYRIDSCSLLSLSPAKFEPPTVTDSLRCFLGLSFGDWDLDKLEE